MYIFSEKRQCAPQKRLARFVWADSSCTLNCTSGDTNRVQRGCFIRHKHIGNSSTRDWINGFADHYRINLGLPEPVFCPLFSLPSILILASLLSGLLVLISGFVSSQVPVERPLARLRLAAGSSRANQQNQPLRPPFQLAKLGIGPKHDSPALFHRLRGTQVAYLLLRIRDK